MPRIKQVPTSTAKHHHRHPSSSKAFVMKKLATAASKAKALMTMKKGSNETSSTTGKLKVPFKPASAAQVALAKKGLLKQLKRRWRSGTVAKREIRKLSRTTNLLFPKRPFQRLVREITQDFKSDIRFTTASMQAIQEAAEIFVTEMFHKSDMARKHAKRYTLHVEDIRFSRFMTQESLWIPPDRIWDKETFTVVSKQQVAGKKTDDKKKKEDKRAKNNKTKDSDKKPVEKQQKQAASSAAAPSANTAAKEADDEGELSASSSEEEGEEKEKEKGQDEEEEDEQQP